MMDAFTKKKKKSQSDLMNILIEFSLILVISPYTGDITYNVPIVR